ncbi:MAG TPA: hypothetical protein VGM56_22650 [Byssovorax sp.]|jgi:hypothetical protein
MEPVTAPQARPDVDDRGVDRTLVRHMLAMTPAERAKSHDALLADVERLAAAGRAARDAGA